LLMLIAAGCSSKQGLVVRSAAAAHLK